MKFITCAGPPPLRRSQHRSAQDLSALHARILDLTSSAVRVQDGKLPSEQRLLYVLEQFAAIVNSLIDAKTANTLRSNARNGEQPEMTATSALLGSVNARSYPAFLTKASVLNFISEKSEEILRHPTTFITSAVLKTYVELQTTLHQPSSFPDIFDLYASKSIPTPTTVASENSIKYTPADPNKVSAAIDSPTANLALTSALEAHNLSLAIDIITTTFCAPAFKKSKILRQALIPMAGIAIAPVAAYTLSTQFSAWQTTMDPSYATGVAFAGIIAYVAHISTIGYVAVTTANDQMDRVTWAQGIPLHERWVREEERAALDRVAGKWGFQAVERRGDEEGEDWERLREFVGMRGMVLDRVELMDGME